MLNLRLVFHLPRMVRLAAQLLLVSEWEASCRISLVNVTILAIKLDYLLLLLIFEGGQPRSLRFKTLLLLFILFIFFFQVLLRLLVQSFLDGQASLNSILKGQMRLYLFLRLEHINRPLPIHVPITIRVNSVVTGGLSPLWMRIQPLLVWL